MNDYFREKGISMPHHFSAQFLRIARSALPLCLIFVGACRPSPAVDPDSERRAAEQTATHMLHDYHAKVSRDGLLAEFEFLDSSDAFFWVPPQATAPMTYDSVRAVLIRNAPNLDTIGTEWLELKVHALSPDIATYVGQVKSFVVGRGDTSRATLLESGTLIRRADGWKLLSGQTVQLPD